MVNNRIKKFIKTVKSIILCIRFPFLYPRNRFTDLHYNNWKIVNFHNKWWKHTEDLLVVHTTTSKEGLNKTDYSKPFEIKIENKNLVAIDNNKKVLVSVPLSEFGEGTVISLGWKKNSLYLLVGEDWKDNPKGNHFIKVVHARWLQIIIIILDWIHRNPLQWIHCIPTYTELGALEPGWRKAFGIDICKEIRANLLKHGLKTLFRYRITQIKEKFGELCWYDYNGTKETFETILKYTTISTKTCINCGKPATKISVGWICPYCDDCIGDRDYTEIGEPPEYYL